MPRPPLCSSPFTYLDNIRSAVTRFRLPDNFYDSKSFGAVFFVLPRLTLIHRSRTRERSPKCYDIDMHHMRVVALLTTALLALPLLASAQETGTPAPGYCPQITQDLKRRDCDEGLNSKSCLRFVPNAQVTELQKFLVDYYDLNPNDALSGYFGRITQQNVIRFQGEQGLPTSGFVGPLTRAAIARVCAGVATTPPPANPPPAPTCSLTAVPTSITLGQSSLLAWFAQNATTGSISSIGSVGLSGSQSVTPTLTTTYIGSFSGHGGATTCQTTVMVTQPMMNASCTYNGQTYADGTTITTSDSCPGHLPVECPQISITCNNGQWLPAGQTTLPPAPTCTLSAYPASIQSGQSTTLTLSTTDISLGETASIDHDVGPIGLNASAFVANITTTTTYTATLTSPFGSGQCSATVTVGGTTGGTCTPDPTSPQTQTLSCPTGQTGVTTQTKTSTCPGPTWGAWTTTGNTCVTATTTPPPSNVGSCIYKGTVYAEGSTVTTDTYQIIVICGNGVWSETQNTTQLQPGVNVCDSYLDYLPVTQDYINLGCSQHPFRAFLSVIPRHGKVPLTVTAKTGHLCATSAPFSWGDGTTENACTSSTHQHTYASSGSYTITYTDANGYSNSANIRVDP